MTTREKIAEWRRAVRRHPTSVAGVHPRDLAALCDLVEAALNHVDDCRAQGESVQMESSVAQMAMFSALVKLGGGA